MKKTTKGVPDTLRVSKYKLEYLLRENLYIYRTVFDASKKQAKALKELESFLEHSDPSIDKKRTQRVKNAHSLVRKGFSRNNQVLGISEMLDRKLFEIMGKGYDFFRLRPHLKNITITREDKTNE